MKKQQVFQRWFKCPDCKCMQSAFKASSHKTKEGHVKDMWCPWCKKVEKFVQVRYH